MAFFLTAFLAMIFCLCGCETLPSSKPTKEIDISRAEKNLGEKPSSVPQFIVQGSAFSISSDGTLYFVDLNETSIVRKLNIREPGEIEVFIDLRDWLTPSEPQGFYIDDLWLDHQQRIVLAESSTGKILRISNDARKLENLADSYDGYRFSKVQGLVGSKKGELFVGSPHSATLYRIDSSKGKLNVFNEDLVRPNDLCLDRNGKRLLVAESDPNRVLVYDLDRNVSMEHSWTLINFKNEGDTPHSLDFVGKAKDHLAVLLGNAELKIFNLKEGNIAHTRVFPFFCKRVRVHKNWVFLQSDDRIYRIRIPKFQ